MQHIDPSDHGKVNDNLLVSLPPSSDPAKIVKIS